MLGTVDKLHTCLTMLLRLPRPAREALLWGVPVAAGAALFSRAKADASAAPAAAVAQLNAASEPAAGATSGLAALVSKLLGQNEFASGGVTLMLLGAAAASARVALGSAARYARRHVMTTAEIDSRDDAYRWLMHYLSQTQSIGKHSTMVSVTSNVALSFGTAVPQQPLVVAPGDEGGPPVAYLPAPGDHLLRHQGKLLLISRRRQSGNPQLAANARLLLEQLTISYLGTSRQPLDALLREAAACYNQSQASRTAVHSVDQDGYWTQIGSRPLRPLSSVVLPQGQAEALLADCQEFLESDAWYAHHGIPYRRGYLLHGPPGTGKTSLVMALAGALLLEIFVVTLSSPSMTDESLRNLLNSAGPRSILLLEDVDAAFVDRSASAGASAGRLTFSGLLNAIDGVAAQEGRLLFMTTNHIERLSNALIRPGRVDVRCFLGPATLQQARDLFVSFYRDLPHLMLQPTGGAAADAGAAFLQLADDSAEATAPAALGGPAATGGGALAAAQGAASDLAAAAGATGDTAGRTPSVLLTAAAKEQQQAERERALQELADQFAARLPPDADVSMAQLQGFLMMHRKNPHAAVTCVKQHLLKQQQQRREAGTSV